MQRALRRLAAASLSLPFLFVVVFFFVPMGWLVATSLSSHDLGSAPQFTGTLEHYARFWTDPFYLESALWNTIKLSVSSTVLALIIGYVLAYYISELPPRRRGLITSLIVVSLSVNIVIRIFGLNVLLMNNGLINSTLLAIGLPRIRMMYSELGELIGSGAHASVLRQHIAGQAGHASLRQDALEQSADGLLDWGDAWRVADR